MELILVFVGSENSLSNLSAKLNEQFSVSVLEKNDPINTIVSAKPPKVILFFASFSSNVLRDIPVLNRLYPQTPILFIHDLERRFRKNEVLEQSTSEILRNVPPPTILIDIIKRNIASPTSNKQLIPFVKPLGYNDPLNSKMHHVLKITRKVAPTDATILLTGESGTGKEVTAQWIHNNSLRQKKPFVAINCGAITESILESELFGHKKGSFTGADSNKTGLFEAAHHGTLFLDEIGEMPYALQVKLLRVLQERRIRPVGDIESIPVDVRIIAATNKDLKVLVEQGHFREDLYFRLNVIRIQLPPLRERREELPSMITQFLDNFKTKYNKDIVELAPSTLNMLMNYGFAGNIRELQNILEYAVIMCESHLIQPQDLPPELHKDSPLNLLPAPLPTPSNYIQTFETLHEFLAAAYNDHQPTVDSVSRILIEEKLKLYGENQKQVAEALGISRTSLWRKMKEFKLSSHNK